MNGTFNNMNFCEICHADMDQGEHRRNCTRYAGDPDDDESGASEPFGEMTKRAFMQRYVLKFDDPKAWQDVIQEAERLWERIEQACETIK